MKLTVVVPTWTVERAEAQISSMKNLQATDDVRYIVVGGQGTLDAMINGGQRAQRNDSDLLMFVHDDVNILESAWDEKVIQAFADPQVGLVGFGGALRFGDPSIYKVQYRLELLIRYMFRSNMQDWQAHGTRATEAQRVAFVDGFCLIFSARTYEAVGGWEAAKVAGLPPFHSYDMWASAAVAEMGFETWLVPVLCHHEGGLTSTTDAYQKFVKDLGWKNGQEVFEVGHRVVYDRFRGVLPIWVA